jgi:hypothetical protein
VYNDINCLFLHLLENRDCATEGAVEMVAAGEAAAVNQRATASSNGEAGSMPVAQGGNPPVGDVVSVQLCGAMSGNKPWRVGVINSKGGVIVTIRCRAVAWHATTFDRVPFARPMLLRWYAL